MNKRILSLTLAGIIALGTMGTTVYADQVTKEVDKSIETEMNDKKEKIVIETKEIKTKNDYEVKINIPVIKGLSDKKYETKLNETIKDKAEKELKAFEKEAKVRKDNNSELYISFEVKANDGVLSIASNSYKYFAGDANGESGADYYNIDVKNNKILTLERLFKDNVNFKEIINSEIKNQISVRDDGLLEGKEGFNGIKEDQSFYVDEYGNLIIVFAEYEIGPKSVGSPEFVISLDSIIEDIKPELIVKPMVLGRVVEIDTKDEARASVPQIKGLEDGKVEQEFNKAMNDIVIGEVNRFKKEVKEYKTDGKAELEVSYDVKNDGSIYSIIVESFKSLPGMAHPENNKYYFNIDINENKELEIKDLFKSDTKYIDFINKEINSQIKLEKENYFEGVDGFTGIKEDQKFYVDGLGNIVFEFDKYDIAPGSTGSPKFRISGYKMKDILKDEYSKSVLKQLDRININGSEVELDKSMYVSNKGTVMMPLVDLSNMLGFEVKWDSKTEIVTLTQEKTKVSIATKENEYKFNDTLVVLENGAEIKDGHVYVPQSFLDTVLYARMDISDGVINIKY